MSLGIWSIPLLSLILSLLIIFSISSNDIGPFSSKYTHPVISSLKCLISTQSLCSLLTHNDLLGCGVMAWIKGFLNQLSHTLFHSIPLSVFLNIIN